MCPVQPTTHLRPDGPSVGNDEDPVLLLLAVTLGTHVDLGVQHSVAESVVDVAPLDHVHANRAGNKLMRKVRIIGTAKAVLLEQRIGQTDVEIVKLKDKCGTQCEIRQG